ncbi:MAG: complex I 24 kDa subunit family protein [Planctomycetota bacterium]|jgi:NADH-quinone oxidoreductase subunit E
MDVDLQPVEEILKGREGDSEALIEAMQDVQRHYHYLPKEALRRVAEGLNVPLSKAYAAATFYAAFSLVPRGKNIVRLCKGTACHVRGAETLEDEISTEIGIRSGETREDLEYTFETVNCLGACAMAPVVVLNEVYHGNLRPGGVKKLLKDG